MQEKHLRQKQQSLDEIKELRDKNNRLTEDLKRQKKQYEQLDYEYQTNTKKQKTIYKDIEDMKEKLSKMKRIPAHILEEYTKFEQELKKKRTQLKCLLENDENKQLEKKIFKQYKDEQKIDLHLEDLNKQSEQLFKQYNQLQKIGIKMKEGKL